MSSTISPTRLKDLRKYAGLTQKGLGKKAKIDSQTIYRIEAGHQVVRPSTVAKLAKALDLLPEVLTDEAPLPASRSEPAPVKPPNDDDYAINVPVDGSIRNAFSLVQMRYRVPIARIVELAPVLFVLAAEASLARRHAKLVELQDMLDSAEDVARKFFPHLPHAVCPSFRAEDAVHAEKKSIDACDIMASTLPDDIFAGYAVINPDYSESEHNPFVLYLRDASPKDGGAALIRGFDRDSTEFEVCREYAQKLAGGDDELAEGIINGEVILHKMPRELLDENAVEARVAWLREKREAYRDKLNRIRKAVGLPEKTS